jgi:hypothetical protein
MTDAEKIVVIELIMAIQGYEKSVGFTVGLPPKPGEFKKRQAEAQRLLDERAATLLSAIEATKTLLGWRR